MGRICLDNFFVISRIGTSSKDRYFITEFDLDFCVTGQMFGLLPVSVSVFSIYILLSLGSIRALTL